MKVFWILTLQNVACVTLIVAALHMAASSDHLIRLLEDLVASLAGRLTELEPDPDRRAQALEIFRDFTKIRLNRRTFWSNLFRRPPKIGVS